jgi:hypothetical protein
MSTEGLFGLDRELAEKAAAKYDPQREREGGIEFLYPDTVTASNTSP